MSEREIGSSFWRGDTFVTIIIFLVNINININIYMRGTFTRCNRLAPGVAEARLVREAVGLRPCRRGGVTISLYFVEKLFTTNHR